MTDKICCNCQYYGGVKGSLGLAPCELKSSMTTWNKTCESIWPIPLRLLIGTVDDPETNADRIRSMSDEELALWKRTECPGSPKPCLKVPYRVDCTSCWLDWLKEEVSDEK